MADLLPSAVQVISDCVVVVVAVLVWVVRHFLVVSQPPRHMKQPLLVPLRYFLIVLRLDGEELNAIVFAKIEPVFVV